MGKFGLPCCQLQILTGTQYQQILQTVKYRQKMSSLSSVFTISSPCWCNCLPWKQQSIQTQSSLTLTQIFVAIEGQYYGPFLYEKRITIPATLQMSRQLTLLLLYYKDYYCYWMTVVHFDAFCWHIHVTGFKKAKLNVSYS